MIVRRPNDLAEFKLSSILSSVCIWSIFGIRLGPMHIQKRTKNHLIGVIAIFSFLHDLAILVNEDIDDVFPHHINFVSMSRFRRNLFNGAIIAFAV